MPHSIPPAPPPAAFPNPPRDREAIEASIRAKEIQKEIGKILARVEPPGGAVPDPVPENPMKNYKIARERLYRARESGTPRQREEAELRMVEAYFDRGEDKKKSSRGSNR